MKELVKGELAGAIGYEAKIEDGAVKISAVVSLEKLIELAAQAVPGDSGIEQLVVSLAKQAVKGI